VINYMFSLRKGRSGTKKGLQMFSEKKIYFRCEKPLQFRYSFEAVKNVPRACIYLFPFHYMF
jgi:hypothetical protein